MIWPLSADDSAVTALPAPVSNTGVQSQAESVHDVPQPFVVTQTSSPPVTHVVGTCWSWTMGVTNRAFGSQSGRGVSPTVACPTHVGLRKELNVCPPSVVE